MGAVVMKSTLKVLNQLSYILECAALDYLGEAKSSIKELCQQLESNGQDYAIENRKFIASQLKLVLEAYRDGNNKEGTSQLVQINRSLWQKQNFNA